MTKECEIHKEGLRGRSFASVVNTLTLLTLRKRT